MLKSHFRSATGSWEKECIKSGKTVFHEWRAVLRLRKMIALDSKAIFSFSFLLIHQLQHFTFRIQFKFIKNSDIYILYYSLTENRLLFWHWIQLHTEIIGNTNLLYHLYSMLIQADIYRNKYLEKERWLSVLSQ